MNKAIVLALFLGAIACESTTNTETILSATTMGWQLPDDGGLGVIVEEDNLINLYYQLNFDFGIESTYAASSLTEDDDEGETMSTSYGVAFYSSGTAAVECQLFDFHDHAMIAEIQPVTIVPYVQTFLWTNPILTGESPLLTITGAYSTSLLDYSVTCQSNMKVFMKSWYEAIVDDGEFVPNSIEDDFGYDDDNESEIKWGKYTGSWASDLSLEDLVKSDNYYTWNVLE